MIEKDNIQDLFSKAFEQHQSAVRPDLWAGVQAKMAAAGVASVGSSAAVKGVSAFTKWMIGTAAVTTLGVGTYFIFPSNVSEKEQKQQVTQVVQNTNETPTTEIKQDNVLFESKNKEMAASGDETVDLSQPLQNVTQYFEELVPQTDFRISVVDPSTTQHLNETISFISEEKPLSTLTNSEEEAKEKTPIVDKTENKPVLEAKINVFPNVFSPIVVDGQNDFYQIDAENLQQFKIMFLDMKNSKVVFESTDVHFKWDGKFNDETLPAGSYVCILSYVDENGKRQQKSQQVEIR